MLQISLGTVKGRHTMPVIDYIIENEIENEIEDVTDVSTIEKMVDDYFKTKIANNEEKVQIILYVTGLTVVTLAVVKSCKKYNCNLVCMHFDRNSDTYIGQKIF